MTLRIRIIEMRGQTESLRRQVRNVRACDSLRYTAGDDEQQMVKDCVVGVTAARLRCQAKKGKCYPWMYQEGYVSKYRQKKKSLTMSGFLRSGWISLTLLECRGGLEDGKQNTYRRSEESGTACVIW